MDWCLLFSSTSKEKGFAMREFWILKKNPKVAQMSPNIVVLNHLIKGGNLFFLKPTAKPPKKKSHFCSLKKWGFLSQKSTIREKNKRDGIIYDWPFKEAFSFCFCFCFCFIFCFFFTFVRILWFPLKGMADMR